MHQLRSKTAYGSLEGGRTTKTKLILFEAVRPMEIGKSIKPGKQTMDLVEERLREMGEPLDKPGSSERIQKSKEELLTMMSKAGQNMNEVQRALDVVLERQKRREHRKD